MDFYGYSNALSQGTAFNSRTKNFNDGVLLANQKLKDEFDAKVKQQPKDEADDSMKLKEDVAITSFTDGRTTVGALAGISDAVSGIRKGGLQGYVVDSTKGRLNTMADTAKRIVKGEPTPPPTTDTPTEVNAEGVVQDSSTTTGDLANAGENAAEAGENVVGKEIESSNFGAKIVKGGLKLVGGAKLGEAGLSAVSEIGGKALGDFGGVVQVGKGFENLADGKNFFSGENTADKLQEVGAVADLAGTVFPPLEVVGGVLSAIGGVMDAYDDIKSDLDKKKQDAAAPDPPKLTATKVTPAFSSLGLAASAPISAKSSITGSSSF